jgi:hypothetical protein
MTACVGSALSKINNSKKTLRPTTCIPSAHVPLTTCAKETCQLASNEHKEQASYRLAKPFFRLPVAALHSQTEAGPGNPGLRAIPHYLPTAIAAQ